MKLVKAFKKTKKNTEPPIPAAESCMVVTSPPPPVAKTAAPPPQAKLSLPEARSVAPAPSAPNATTIEALIDVGFGNHLFLRGQGAGLSWDRGTPLACVDGQTWRWSAPTTDKLTFKLLLNDKVWAQGEDIVATPGKCIGVVPRF
jgi:hypothetical protein